MLLVFGDIAVRVARTRQYGEEHHRRHEGRQKAFVRPETDLIAERRFQMSQLIFDVAVLKGIDGNEDSEDDRRRLDDQRDDLGNFPVQKRGQHDADEADDDRKQR